MKKDEVILIATLPIALQTLLHTIITLVGFTSSGVGARTLAAFIQSVFYAGTITSGGIFAILQHLGATGVLFPNIISIIYTLIMLCIFLYRKIEKEENK
jgi:hypothetical protein